VRGSIAEELPLPVYRMSIHEYVMQQEKKATPRKKAMREVVLMQNNVSWKRVRRRLQRYANAMPPRPQVAKCCYACGSRAK